MFRVEPEPVTAKLSLKILKLPFRVVLPTILTEPVKVFRLPVTLPLIVVAPVL